MEIPIQLTQILEWLEQPVAGNNSFINWQIVLIFLIIIYIGTEGGKKFKNII